MVHGVILRISNRWLIIKESKIKNTKLETASPREKHVVLELHVIHLSNVFARGKLRFYNECLLSLLPHPQLPQSYQHRCFVCFQCMFPIIIGIIMFDSIIYF